MFGNTLSTTAANCSHTAKYLSQSPCSTRLQTLGLYRTSIEKQYKIIVAYTSHESIDSNKGWSNASLQNALR